MVTRTRVSVTLYYVACLLVRDTRIFFYQNYLVLVVFMNCFAFLIMWPVND